jgi:hypothetical protein
LVGADGSSSVHDLQMAMAYDWAAAMEEALGSRALAGECREASARLKPAIRSPYSHPAKGLFADSRQKDSFSQHANALAVLAGLNTSTTLAR